MGRGCAGPSHIFVMNETWVLARLPPGKKATGSQCVVKVKRLPDGPIDKYKGKIVAQGFSQARDIHYNEVFAPTARIYCGCAHRYRVRRDRGSGVGSGRYLDTALERGC